MPALFSKQADKFLDKLDRNTEDRIMNAIDKIPLGDIKPYVGTDYLRLRVGDYRILFKWVNDGELLVHHIGVRGDVYKKGV